MVDNIGLVIELGLLIFLVLRGINVIFATLLGAFTFAGKFFLLFVGGAMFGRIMSVTNSATTIATAMTNTLGKKRALWIIVLASALLTYGGVVVFVVIFAMYPLGLKLSEQANIPKRLLCGAIALGAGTFTMTALPGTPSIHNVIAARALGTDLYAGAGLGILASIILLGSILTVVLTLKM